MTNTWTVCGLPAFGAPADGRAQSLKVFEEASELCEAGKRYELSSGFWDGSRLARTRMLDEFADLLQTMVNLAECFGIAPRDVEAACRRCEERNRARGRY